MLPNSSNLEIQEKKKKMKKLRKNGCIRSVRHACRDVGKLINSKEERAFVVLLVVLVWYASCGTMIGGFENLKSLNLGQQSNSREALGRGSWMLLHKMSLNYPNNPTEKDVEDMASFLHLFAKFYPCSECAEHFRDFLKSYPPERDLGSRTELAQWVCDAHNEVNRRQEKPTFICTMEELEKRWGGCKEKENTKNNRKGQQQGEDASDDSDSEGLAIGEYDEEENDEGRLTKNAARSVAQNVARIAAKMKQQQRQQLEDSA
eukprot:g2417.t1